MGNPDDSLNKLAELIFEKSGLKTCVPSLLYEAECDFEGEWGEDGKDHTVRTELFILEENGNFGAYKQQLNDKQQEIIKRLSRDGTLIIYASREPHQSCQLWEFTLYVPLIWNEKNSAKIALDLKAKVVESRDVQIEIQAMTKSMLSMKCKEEMLLLYQLLF